MALLAQFLLPILVAICSTGLYFVAITPRGEAWNSNWINMAEKSSFTQKIIWLHEGVHESASFTQFAQNQTFCFAPDSTLPFRVDDLNDPRQPYLVQWIAQLDGINEKVEELKPYVTPLQMYANVIQPFIWGWSDLRVLVSSEQQSKLSYNYKTPPSTVCHIIDHLQNQLHGLLRDYLPEFSMYLLAKTLDLMKSYCEGCSSGCPLACDESNNPSLCMVKLSPYEYPCVTVSGPKTGYLMSDSNVSFEFAYYSVISLAYGRNLLLGYFLYFFSIHLARSRLFHYFLGAVIGIVCSVALLLYQLYKQSQSTFRLLPGSSLIQGASLLTTVAFPVTGLMLLPTVYSIIVWALGLLFTFWMSDEVFGIPHLGKLYFLFFGLLGMTLVWWFQWWAPSSSNEPEAFENNDDDEDNVLDDIRRMEMEDANLPDNQLRLARILQLTGIMLLFQSASSTLISWVLVLIALLWSFLEALYAHLYYWYWSETPGLHSTLITSEEYTEQGKTETEKALKALREYLKENPEVAETVREDNEVRIRRFMHGRDHMETANKANKFGSQANSKSSWCCIQ